jgi:hypothetical protein
MTYGPQSAWKFHPGQTVYVRHRPMFTGTIVDYCVPAAAAIQWPHYFVRCNVTGDEWRISQLELASSPISAKDQ